MAIEFKLPKLGEQVSAADVVRIMVSNGDVVKKDQPVIELETEKAATEVPSDVEGTVREVHVKQGDKVEVGDLILTLDPLEPEADKQRAPEPKEEEPVPESRTPGEEASQPPPPKSKEPPAKPAPEQPEPAPRSEHVPVAAAPSVRRLAREIGIDVSEVEGSGPGGRISIDDVKAHARKLSSQRESGMPALAPVAAQLPDFSRWGRIERQAMSSIRRKTAEHVHQAWTTIPHVTQFDVANITELEELRKRFLPKVEKAGGKLTVTAILLKIVASALKVFPRFNASLDVDKQEVILKKYINIGVAVDTERGLIVPVIHNADGKNIIEIAVELNQLAEKTRTGKVSVDELQGGTFTLTNLGGIGGTHFTPIINSPEVAILGVGRARMEPSFEEGVCQPRLMLPLSLSYDHRLIDGADGARFVRWIAEACEEPLLIPLEG